MLDIGWSELLLIGIVALIVVGPKELPTLFRTVGQFTGRARAMAREFQRSLEQAADESGVNDVTKSIRGIDPAGFRGGLVKSPKLTPEPARPEGAAELRIDPGAPEQAAAEGPSGETATELSAPAEGAPSASGVEGAPEVKTESGQV
jgi:sec-independent protein translocase protein TatB